MARLTAWPPRQAWTRAGVLIGLVLLIALWASGLLLEVWPAESAFELPAPQAALRHGAVVLHGVGAWVACIAAGRWVWPHVARVWRLPAGASWWLGIAAAAMAAGVSVTGLALLYGPGDWHERLGEVHWWIAVGWPALVLVHARRLWTHAS